MQSDVSADMPLAAGISEARRKELIAYLRTGFIASGWVATARRSGKFAAGILITRLKVLSRTVGMWRVLTDQAKDEDWHSMPVPPPATKTYNPVPTHGGVLAPIQSVLNGLEKNVKEFFGFTPSVKTKELAERLRNADDTSRPQVVQTLLERGTQSDEPEKAVNVVYHMADILRQAIDQEGVTEAAFAALEMLSQVSHRVRETVAIAPQLVTESAENFEKAVVWLQATAKRGGEVMRVRVDNILRLLGREPTTSAPTTGKVDDVSKS